jgi:ATP-binding cassette, subfamily B, bacterial
MARRFGVEDDAPKVKVTKENFREALKIFKYIRPYKWSFWGGLMLLFLSSISFMVFPYLSGLMVDIAQGKAKMPITLAQAGMILGGILILQGVISYYRVILFANVSEKGIADLRLDLYSHLVSLPVTFFENSRVGEIVSRLTADVEKLYATFSITLAEFIRQVIILISGIFFLAITTPKLALIMILTFPVIVIGAMVFGRYIRKLSKQRQDQIADTNIVLSETMQAINVVKAFTNEYFEIKRYKTTNDKAVKISMKFAAGRAIFAVFIVVILFGALFFVLWEGAMMLQKGEITAGQLITFFTYTAIIGGAIAGLGSFYTELVGAVGATERIREILHKTPEKITNGSNYANKIALQGEVEFQHIAFNYPTRQDIEVLKDVNLKISPGQKVALVGHSGAGKSTIIQLLLRFYPKSGGKLFIDGKEIEDYDLTSYRQNFAIVPQEVMLFGGTIRENILYGRPDATDEEIIEAAQKSNCWEFITTFPEALETIVGERGVKLSGGQRQRIAIARAILKNPAILLLDEATSSLDAESEKVVQEALNILMEGRTSIIIAHRLATIKDVDCIYVLDKGIIAEQGTHEALSEKPNGIYNNLAKLQFEWSQEKN